MAHPFAARGVAFGAVHWLTPGLPGLFGLTLGGWGVGDPDWTCDSNK